MIPKIIHYIWLGTDGMPKLVGRCLSTWHDCMPESEGWIYRQWNELTIVGAMGCESFNDVLNMWPAYVREAYEAKKYAFASDYVRLWALERYGGLYLDVDFEVYKSFEPLLQNHFFAGIEGSKYMPVMMGVLGVEPHSPWMKEMIKTYSNRRFIKTDNTYDYTTNVAYFTRWLRDLGCNVDGHEVLFNSSQWLGAPLHIYPVDYFCPSLTTGENVRSANSYCDCLRLNSWNHNINWRRCLVSRLPKWLKIYLIKLKRYIMGHWPW